MRIMFIQNKNKFSPREIEEGIAMGEVYTSSLKEAKEMASFQSAHARTWSGWVFFESKRDFAIWRNQK